MRSGIRSTLCSATRPIGRARSGVVCGFCVIALLSGCGSNRADPFEPVNRFIFGFNGALDRYAVKPAADIYVKVMPWQIRNGIGNFFKNLVYLNVIANDFLQGDVDQGLRDAARMGVNTTVGIAGVFDVATGWGLPANQNDLGITFGKWGFAPGPYLVLPLFGPSTLRDSPSYLMEAVLIPLFWFDIPCYVTAPMTVTGIVDARARSDFIFRFRDETALDPYVFTRAAFLQYRAARIRGPEAPPPEDFYDEEMDSPTQPASEPVEP